MPLVRLIPSIPYDRAYYVEAAEDSPSPQPGSCLVEVDQATFDRWRAVCDAYDDVYAEMDQAHAYSPAGAAMAHGEQ